jgi:hypothetical protein
MGEIGGKCSMHNEQKLIVCKMALGRNSFIDLGVDGRIL